MSENPVLLICFAITVIAFIIGPSLGASLLINAQARKLEAEARLLEARFAFSDIMADGDLDDTYQPTDPPSQ